MTAPEAYEKMPEEMVVLGVRLSKHLNADRTCALYTGQFVWPVADRPHFAVSVWQSPAHDTDRTGALEARLMMARLSAEDYLREHPSVTMPQAQQS